MFPYVIFFILTEAITFSQQSRKRKLSAQEDAKNASTVVKVAKATGSGRRRLHFTVENSEEEEEEEEKKPIGEF